MADAEKVINALECCNDPERPKCYKCPEQGPGFGYACRDNVWTAALALLKAQVPRVMTLEEIQDGGCYWFDAGKDFAIRPVICVLKEEDARKRYVCFAWQFGTFCCEADDYGKTWHCWTSRPTDEQREAVKWDG